MRRRLSCAVLGLLLIGLPAVVAAGEPAGIALIREIRPDGSPRLIAAVTDSAGAPAEGATVTFLARTAFGWLTLAEVATDADGRAAFVLPPAPVYAEVRAVAGDGEALSATARLAEPAARDPVRRPGLDVLRRLSPQPGLVSPYPPIQIVFVAGLLGGIWATYAYLVSLLIRMKRAH